MGLFKNGIGRPSNEVLKKRRTLKALLVIVVFAVAFSVSYSITNTLTNFNTKRLKGITSEVSTIPNSNFNNLEFYRLVVDSYNNQTGSNYNYSEYSLTDEQLSVIKVIESNGQYNFNNIDGIEKLTGLEKLNIVGKRIVKVNLSKNIKLKYLNLSGNHLTSIDLSNNQNLEEIVIISNNLKNLDLSNNKNLRYLNASYNNITSIDLSNNSKLEDAILNANRLFTINIGSQPELKNLNLLYNNLDSIDASGASNLKELYIDLHVFRTFDYNNFNYLEDIISGTSILIGEKININTYLERLSINSFSVNEQNAISYNNGEITAVNQGVGLITYYLDNNKRFSLNVTVTKNEAVDNTTTTIATTTATQSVPEEIQEDLSFFQKIGSFFKNLFTGEYFKSCFNNNEKKGNLTGTVERIVGADGYCNKDANGNIKSCEAAGITSKLACIAYSQVDYKEKKSQIGVSSCSANKGTSNFQKYGTTGEWSLSFAKWVLTKANNKGVTLTTDLGTSSCDANGLKEGDFVAYSSQQGKYIGILYKDKLNRWHVIIGNYNNQVYDIKSSRESALPIIPGNTVSGCKHNS